MLDMIQYELEKGYKTIYSEAMEARVYFHKDITKGYGDTIAQYQAWYHFITEDHQENVVELVFSQASE